MFESLNKIIRAITNPEEAELRLKNYITSLNDEVANKTSFKPLKKSNSTNFETRKLVKDTNGNLSYKITLGAILFSLLFIFIWLSVIFFGILQFTTKHELINILFRVLFWIIFTWTWFLSLYTGNLPITFNLISGQFYKKRLKIDYFDRFNPVKNFENNELYLPFSSIHAFQIIKVYKSKYEYYELNIVLKDWSRVNVVNKPKLLNTQKEAELLSLNLWKPVWFFDNSWF